MLEEKMSPACPFHQLGHCFSGLAALLTSSVLACSLTNLPHHAYSVPPPSAFMSIPLGKI